MKKLLVDKNEEIASIVERIISDTDDELTLVIPKGSRLNKYLGNFHILHREVVAAGKNLIIESVDNETLALAEKSGVEAYHPLFKGDSKNRAISDIVHQKGKNLEVKEEEPEEESVIKPVKKTGKSRVTGIDLTGEEVHTAESESDDDDAHEETPLALDHLVSGDRPAGEKAESKKRASIRFTATPGDDRSEKTSPALQEMVRGTNDEATVQRRMPRLSMRRALWGGGILVLVVGSVWLVNTAFGTAAIYLRFTETPWSASMRFVANKTVAQSDYETNVIPAEVVSQKKTDIQFFPASDRREVSRKAKGRITIYNAFSSAPQTLVATTRFLTPDDKLFRLDKQITVPGAEVKDGQIIPSSIDADVTADVPGVEMNAGPVGRLSIPGFKGTPRYGGFYGELKEGTSGGFVGEQPVPTDADIAAARQATEDSLRTNLTDNLLANRPDNLIVIEGTEVITINRLTVNPETNEQGQFSVFGEATFQAVAFSMTDVRETMQRAANAEHPGLAFEKFVLTYEDPDVDFAEGVISFTAHTDAQLGPAFVAEQFRDIIAGKSVQEARNSILALPELSEGRIKLWPIWLGKVPGNTDRIEVTVE